jgi:hypothetical protein
MLNILLASRDKTSMTALKAGFEKNDEPFEILRNGFRKFSTLTNVSTISHRCDRDKALNYFFI